jgi:hypothetical protein
VAEAAWTSWTTANLALYASKLIEANADSSQTAAGAAALRIAAECGIELWTRYDWRFRRKLESLSLTAGTATVAAPADFGEFDQNWLCDYDKTDQKLRFTQDVRRFQAMSDQYVSGESGPPVLILAERDTSESAWAWRFRVTPTPDQAYTYTYWHVAADPWTTGSLTVDDAPVWPPSFNLGWQLLTYARALQFYGNKDDAQKAWRAYEEWLESQREERDETMTLENDRIQDGYGDIARMASMGAGIPWPFGL